MYFFYIHLLSFWRLLIQNVYIKSWEVIDTQNYFGGIEGKKNLQESVELFSSGTLLQISAGVIGKRMLWAAVILCQD